MFLVRLIESVVTVKRLINGRDQHQAPVVQMVDCAIHWLAQLVSQILIHWIEIYPVDSTIQLLNKRGVRLIECPLTES